MQYAAAELLRRAFLTQRYSDVKLVITDKYGSVHTRPAHKLVVEYFSPVLAKMLRLNPDSASLTINIPSQILALDVLLTRMYQAESKHLLGKVPVLDLLAVIHTLSLVPHFLKDVIRIHASPDNVQSIVQFLLSRSFDQDEIKDVLVGLICTYANELTETWTPLVRHHVAKVAANYPVWCAPNNKVLRDLLQTSGVYKRFCFQRDTCVWGIPSGELADISTVDGETFTTSRNFEIESGRELHLLVQPATNQFNVVYVCDPCGEPLELELSKGAATLQKFKHRVYQTETIRVIFE